MFPYKREPGLQGGRSQKNTFYSSSTVDGLLFALGSGDLLRFQREFVGFRFSLQLDHAEP
jgi:hypothetical protein